jgi:hypothetical protein
MLQCSMKEILMATTTTNPWVLFAETVRQGVDNYVATQKTLLDIAVQQNALLVNAMKQGFSMAVSPLVADLAARGTQTFLQSQRAMLDMAAQQNKLGLDLLKNMAGANRPFVSEMADMMERGTRTFVDAQKRLLEFAEQQAGNQNPGQSLPNPMTQIYELSRQGLESFVEAQKRFLDMVSQQATSATDRWKERAEARAAAAPAEGNGDLLGLARQTFENYVNMQRQFAETAGRAMTDWTQSWQNGGVGQSATGLQDLARKGVEAFINTQRTLLDLTFRSMNPGAPR